MWILLVAHTPFAMRKVPHGGRYTLVEEVYIHGVMQGELLDTELAKDIGPVEIE